MISNISSGGYSAMMMQGMQHKAPPNAEQIAEDLLSSADTDGNGSISKAEFSAAFGSDNDTDSSTVSGLFAEMDADGNEEVSVDEASNAISNLLQQLQEQRFSNTNMPPPPPSEGMPNAEDLMASADSDEDGGLTVDEFSSALRKSDDESETAILANMFAETDLDGDGIVSQAELKTAMENKQASRENSSVAENIGNTGNSDNRVAKLVNSILQQYQQSLVTEESISIIA